MHGLLAARCLEVFASKFAVAGCNLVCVTHDWFASAPHTLFNGDRRLIVRRFSGGDPWYDCEFSMLEIGRAHV